MKRNPDNRSDNVKNIEQNIDSTLHNIHLADEMISQTSDEELKAELQQKNKRRDRALQGMRHEIRDEASFQNKKQ